MDPKRERDRHAGNGGEERPALSPTSVLKRGRVVLLTEKQGGLRALGKMCYRDLKKKIERKVFRNDHSPRLQGRGNSHSTFSRGHAGMIKVRLHRFLASQFGTPGYRPGEKENESNSRKIFFKGRVVRA